MATHRSLNKLEFKAHMSMHNFVEVPEEETQGPNSTRDRFGKKHNLSDADGKKRLPAGRQGVGRSGKILLPLILFQAVCWTARAADSGAHPSTNIQVSSTDQDLYSLDKKLNPPDENAAFYQSQNNRVGINEDGDPSVNTQF
jgi:hypothetical protein